MAGRSVAARTRTAPTSSALLPFHPKTGLERQWHDSYRRGYELDRQRLYFQAAEAFEASLPLARRANCLSCELRTQSNLGADRLAAMQYREALDAFLAARSLAERVGDRQMAGLLSLNLSNLYLHRYALPEAIAAAEVALASLEDATQPWLRAKVLIQKARLTARQGDLAGAVRVYRVVIAEASQRGDTATQAMAWEHLGLEYWRRGDLAPADSSLNEAFRLRRMTKDAALGTSYLSLSLLRNTQGDHHSAMHLADRALEEWLRIPVILPLWQLRLARGRALAGLQRDREALAELDAALDQIRLEGVELLPADSLRIGYGSGTYEVYATRIELGAELALATGNRALLEESFGLAEEARARSLRQSTGEWAVARRNLPAGHSEALDQLQTAQVELMRTNSSAARRELDQVRRRLTEIEAAAGLALPSHRLEGASATEPRPSGSGHPTSVTEPRPRGSGHPTSLADARGSVGRLLAADEALFSFYLGGKRSFLWVATREGLRAYRLPPRGQVASAVADFTARLRAGDSATLQGQQLYRDLFSEAASVAESKRRWLLSLDAGLFDLPFAALVPERGVYLVQRHALELIPGSWALAPSAEPRRWNSGLVAVGDPIYNTADPRWTGAAPLRASLQLPRLIGSGGEIRACARDWNPDGRAPSGPAFLLEGKDATWDRLRAEIELRRPAALHLATHYIGSPDDQRQVVMALGIDQRGEPQYAGPERIASLRLATRLVVLSGCGSGDGPTRAGEGRAGIARAWLLAGAQSVVATYWPTNDDAGQLIQDFYGFWRHPERPSSYIRPGDALQKAQIEMIRNGSWKAEPRYWASHFVITKN